MTDSLYAPPVLVTSLEDCEFYHTMEVPGHGLVHGRWDHRDGASDYLGHVDLAGRRVLEVGPASGFFTNFMERAGAEVIAYDLSEKESWDLVPMPDLDSDAQAGEWRALLSA